MRQLFQKLRDSIAAPVPQVQPVPDSAINFERFAPQTNAIATRTVEVLRRFGDNWIDVHHILLVLLEQPNDTMSAVFRLIQTDADFMQAELAREMRHVRSRVANPSNEQIYITPAVKHVIDVAYNEAQRLKDEQVLPEHLLLAVLIAPDHLSSSILSKYDITWEQANRALSEVRGES